MRADTAPAWLAGAGDVRFDGPKCLFRYSAAHRVSDAWVSDYYSQAKVDAALAFFVVASDVVSPMGDDLVPFANREDADAFVHDHGGRVLRRNDVSATLLEELR